MGQRRLERVIKRRCGEKEAEEAEEEEEGGRIAARLTNLTIDVERKLARRKL